MEPSKEKEELCWSREIFQILPGGKFANLDICNLYANPGLLLSKIVEISTRCFACKKYLIANMKPR